MLNAPFWNATFRQLLKFTPNPLGLYPSITYYGNFSRRHSYQRRSNNFIFICFTQSLHVCFNLIYRIYYWYKSSPTTIMLALLVLKLVQPSNLELRLKYLREVLFGRVGPSTYKPLFYLLFLNLFVSLQSTQLTMRLIEISLSKAFWWSNDVAI